MAASARHDRRKAENALGALLDAVLDGQARAIAAVGGARADIARAAECAAAAIRGGGRLVYLGAGASGGAAFQDYAEMPGTFGLAPSQIHWIGPDAPGAPYSGDGEDDVSAGRAAVDGLRLGARDALIAVSASGATPYTVAGARAAKSAGADGENSTLMSGYFLLNAGMIFEFQMSASSLRQLSILIDPAKAAEAARIAASATPARKRL